MSYTLWYTDDELISIMQQVAALESDGRVTVARWSRMNLNPTATTYEKRFGSWIKACEAAGVAHGEAPPRAYTRISDDKIIAAVREFFAERTADGGKTTYLAYEAWARESRDRPCAANVRNRMGNWGAAKERALAT